MLITENERMIYINLVIGFLKLGCFAFGGAYGTIPIIRKIVLSYAWLTEEELTYMIAVSESTPGPIMVNLATYIGSSQAGFWCAVLSTIAVILPSFFIALLLMIVLKNMLENKYVRAIVRGVKPCMIGIIFATEMYMILTNTGLHGEKKLDIRVLLLVLFLSLLRFLPQKIVGKRLSSMNLIMLSAVFGIVFYDFC